MGSGRWQDLVGPDIIGQHLEAAFDRLERDPAIAPEQLARTGLQAGIVEALMRHAHTQRLPPPSRSAGQRVPIPRPEPIGGGGRQELVSDPGLG